MTPRTLSFSRLSGLGPLPKLFEAEEGRPALQRLLASEDVRLDGLPPSTPIPFPNLNEVFNRATRLSGDILFPLRVALSMRPEDYGPLVIYALGAATLEAGIKRLNRFAALQSSASILVLRDARGEAAWSLEYIRARGLRVDRHALHVLAPMIAFIRRYAGASAEPIQLELPSGADTGHGAIGEALGVPVRAAADVFRVVFPSEWLNRQRPRARSEQILSYLDMMAYYRGDVLPRTMTDTVAALLAPVIGATELDLDAVAGKLKVSRRSLQQHLNAEGTSFRDISLGVRIRQAQRLILASREPMAQVALAVGYSDQAHFTRAFKMLTGSTPDEFRRVSRDAARLPEIDSLASQG